jgi:hypothetical protein
VKIKGNKKIERIFAFIRYAMDPESQSAPEMREKDWLRLLDFADEQALTGVLFWGLKEIGHTDLTDSTDFFSHTEITETTERVSGKPDYDLMLEWGFVAQVVEDQNKAINKKCVEVLKELEDAGFQCCVLKGQGNAMMYPNPLSRMPGDIDVLIRKADRKKLSSFAKTKNVTGHHFHHIEYEEEGGIGVELHFIPCSMNNPVYHRRLQKWFAEQADREDIWNHRVKLPDTEEMISIPTVGFNMVYQLAHMMHHFFDEGIGLRQIMDYFYLLQEAKDELKIENGELKIILRYLGLWKFAGAVMYVMREVFHLEERFMIAPVDERRGETLMEEILKGGNFGHYSGLTDHSMGAKYFLKIKRNMRFVCQYPTEALCEPVFRTWHFFWRLTQKGN